VEATLAGLATLALALGSSTGWSQDRTSPSAGFSSLWSGLALVELSAARLARSPLNASGAVSLCRGRTRQCSSTKCSNQADAHRFQIEGLT